MSGKIDVIKALIDELSDADREVLGRYAQIERRHPLETDWGISAHTILGAIRRSSDLTKRGVRGIIAEAVFETGVLPRLKEAGWNAEELAGDLGYDVRIEKDERTVTIQIKLQRLEKGVPKLYYPKHYNENPLYVVEVQKTRSGEKKQVQQVRVARSHKASTQTRPYRFGDFDILAVNMHPSSGIWADFRYTVGNWLLPRQTDNTLIEVLQPVSPKPNEVWTDDLTLCLKWLELGAPNRLLKDLRHLRKPQSIKPKRKQRVPKPPRTDEV